jgi:sodium/hydrogen antiporter
MSYLGWMAVCGGLLLMMALSSAYIGRLPISTSIIYLAAGVALGPIGFNLIRFDIREEVAWLERIAEAAVIISLFVIGVKLRLPLRAPAWQAPLRLAGPLMLFSIAGVALFCYVALEIPLGGALLLGAVLAPTDPVLASAVAVESASDHDRVRYGLSGEAGLNDGAAFPFVVLSLRWIKEGSAGPWIGGWALHRLLWAVPAGLLFGYVLGRLLGRLAVYLRSRERDTAAPSDFLALALIALAYVGAEAIGAWGFLSTFAAGLGLRGAELKVVRESPAPSTALQRGEDAEQPTAPGDQMSGADLHPPAEDFVAAKLNPDALGQPALAAGTLLAEVLSFGDTAERLLEVMLVLIVGIALAPHWDVRAFAVAGALMVLVRPLGVHLVLLGTRTTFTQRWVMGWFGIRGIGSLYYLSYALREGVSQQVASDVSAITVSVIAISVIMHGITAQPVLTRYEKSLAR